MAMTACYPNYDLSGSQGMTQHHHQSHHSAIQSNRLSSSTTTVAHQQQQSPQQQKDYSIPLHVDCSVEYELPNQAKPPVGSRVEPLLMIHPCYFRKMESQRRSPFVNNMPNTSTRSSSSSLSNLSTTVASSSASTSASSTVLASSRRNNSVNTSTASISNPSKSSNSHMLSHQNHIQLQPIQAQQQQISHHHHLHQQAQQTQAIHNQPTMPNLQQQLDEYMQRQMVHMSQQAQYPVGANIQHSSNQYMQHASATNQSQHSHQQQMTTAANWDRYMSVASNASDMLARVPTGKVNIPNQAAYKKSGKRSNNMLSATCANSYSSNALEGGLPNNVGRWDMEKASMAAIPRDFQAGPESLPPAIQQPQAHKASAMYRTTQVGKRDAMLSGGSCTMYNSNTNTDISSLASGLWDPIEKSPMATIPSNYQAGPDSIPNNHSSNSVSSKPTMVNSNSSNLNRRASGATTLSYHHQQPLQQPPQQQQLIHHQLASDKLNVSGKYRQYLRSHRLHPYMMTGNMPGVAQSMSAASQFPHLNGNVFPQIQQVSCYNV